MSADKSSYTYAQAGVSIDAGNALVKAIGPLVRPAGAPATQQRFGLAEFPG